MRPQNLNPRNREWPTSDPEYGQVLKEQFFECRSGPKRVALVKKEGEHFLAFHKCQVREGEVRFEKEVRFKLDDGTAAVALRLAHDMLYDWLQSQLGGDAGRESRDWGIG